MIKKIIYRSKLVKLYFPPSDLLMKSVLPGSNVKNTIKHDSCIFHNLNAYIHLKKILQNCIA